MTTLRPSLASRPAAVAAPPDPERAGPERSRLIARFATGWTTGGDDRPLAPQAVTRQSLPEPFARLLDHRRGMTEVLNGHWGGDLRVRVVHQAPTDDGMDFVRRVVLLSGPEELPVQLAGLRLPLAAFTPAFHTDLLAGQALFGDLLRRHAIVFHTEVLDFLAGPATGVWAHLAGVASGAPLYGRLAALRTADGALLAEAMELLPRT
jgi:hypothetical protein